ncbi:hypothetical protein KIU71_01275 [Alteromonas sp. SM 2104]|nr:hypothetical protein [Alteromonas oceanisediminis]
MCQPCVLSALPTLLQDCHELVASFLKEPALVCMQLRHHGQRSVALAPRLGFIDSAFMLGQASCSSASVIQQMVVGILIYTDTSFHNGSPRAPSHAVIKQWLTVLNTPQMGVAYQSLLHLCRLRKTPALARQQTQSHLVKLLLNVAWLNVEKKRSYQSILADRATSAPQHSALFNAMVGVEAPTWVGRIAKYEASYCFVLGHRRGKLLLVTLPDESVVEIAANEFARLELVDKTLGFSRWYRAFSADKSQHADLPSLGEVARYPIQTPPASLLSVVQAINHPNAEPQAIAKLVETNPLFVEILRGSAEQLNRLNLRVDNVLQSILTHGLDRIGAILTEQALWHRLTLSQFPLARSFQQLCELHRFTAASLAQLLKHPLPQNISLLATLQLSALFTYAPLRTRWQWRLPMNTPESAETLLATEPPVPFASHAVMLAKAWQQPPALIKRLTQLSEASTEPHHDDVHILKASLALSRYWFEGKDVELTDLTQQLSNNRCIDQLSGAHFHQLRCDAAKFLYCRVF